MFSQIFYPIRLFSRKQQQINKKGSFWLVKKFCGEQLTLHLFRNWKNNSPHINNQSWIMKLPICFMKFALFFSFYKSKFSIETKIDKISKELFMLTKRAKKCEYLKYLRNFEKQSKLTKNADFFARGERAIKSALLSLTIL